jgi:hypothetical protein
VALSVHHGYDPLTGTMYYGDGNTRHSNAMPSIVRKVCGGKAFNSPLGDGGLASEANVGLFNPLNPGIAVSPEGRL